MTRRARYNNGDLTKMEGNTMSPIPGLFNKAEAAEYLEMNLYTLEDHIRRGWFPEPKTLGNTYYWTEEQLRRYQMEMEERDIRPGHNMDGYQVTPPGFIQQNLENKISEGKIIVRYKDDEIVRVRKHPDEVRYYLATTRKGHDLKLWNNAVLTIIPREG